LTSTQPAKKSFFQKERLFSAISIGSLLILLGVIYLLYPGNFFDDLSNFLKNFTLVLFPSTNISLPAPLHTAANLTLYWAAFEFSVGVGIIEVIILSLRLNFHSNPRRTAETVANIVNWFGFALLIYVYLLTETSVNKWFVFWAGVIIVVGLSLIARSFVDLAYKWKKKVAAPTPEAPMPPPPAISL
jgi:hypothetical protein